MYGLRTPDYDNPEAGREKHKRFEEKGLKQAVDYGIIFNRDT